MGEVRTSTMVREALKAVVGKEAYGQLGIYVDKRKTGYRVKVEQRSWANITAQQVAEVAKYVKDVYGVEVKITEGQSGGHNLEWVAFTA